MNYNYFPKVVFLFGILIFTVIQNCQAVDFDKDLDAAEAPNATLSTQGITYQDVGCGIHRLNNSISLNIQLPYFQSEHNSSSQECTWEFYGTSEECNPEITCDNFDLLDTPSCDTEYLELGDASGGRAKFCGTIAPKIASSSSILIAYFKTEVQDIDRGFHCNVACAPPGSASSSFDLSSSRKGGGKAVQVCSAVNRIVGGKATTIEDLPYQVSVQSRGSHICGGSIISNDRILTAAHCTAGASPSSLSVRAKSTYRGSGGDVINVKFICQHPEFNGKTSDKDVSVLKLADSINFDETAQSICIPPVGSSDEIADGTLATVSGWGAPKEGGFDTSKLMKVDVPRVSEQECKDDYGDSAITNNMMCFGYKAGGKDSCQGDRGGPLVITNGGRTQVGIVSWGEGCAKPDKPGVYTDLSARTIYNHIMKCSKLP